MGTLEMALDRNTTATERMAASITAYAEQNTRLMEMWCKTLKFAEERDKRNNRLIWALVLTVCVLAGVNVAQLVGLI